MPPRKDQAPIYIDGPKMVWSMDDGLYSTFQDWKLECELILDGELTEIAEPPKSQHTHLMGWIIQFKKPQCVAEG